MNIKILVLSLATAALAGCKTTDKTVKKENNPVKEMSIDVPHKYEETKEYRGSRTRPIEIIDTKLEVKPDWDKEWLYGKALITFKPYFYPTDSVVLDAKGFDINEVSFVSKGGGHWATPYTYDSSQLHVFLGKEFTRDDTVKVFIGYTAKPNDVKDAKGSAAITDAKGLYFINADGKDHDKPKQIWTQGETESNSCWFPTFDSPNERMTQTLAITVDTQYVTLSNGLLKSSKVNPDDGTRTDVWKQSLPAAPYLTMFSVGKFAIVKDKWRNIDVNYYVEPEYEQYGRNIFGHTPEMLDTFSARLGVDYPWEKFSQIVVRDYISGAMENTTCVLHGEYLERNDRELLDETNEDVISHELFHHWFGDLVTCESWSNIPLNESFATYGEYIWNESKYGRDYADQRFAHELTNYLLTSRQKDPDVIRYYYDDKEDMFDGISYAKGSRILHMLRKVVGDDAFFASLKLYLNTNKFSSVEIHNLRLAFEQITGKDMNWFFNEWWLNHGHPDFDITYQYDAGNKKEIMTVKQSQDIDDNPLYKMPVKVDIYVNGSIQHHEINIEKRKEDFSFDVPGKPDLVNFDAEKMLLCTKTDDHSQAEWDFMFRHAPLYMDRYEGFNRLIKSYEQPGDSIVLHAIETALNDKNYNIRKMALENIYRVINDSPDKTKKEILKTKLIDMSQHDNKSVVRVEAINTLEKNFDDTLLYPLYKKIATFDLSYDVDVAALKSLYNKNETQGFELARSMEQDSSSAIIEGIASIYADHGTGEQNAFFLKRFKKTRGMSRYHTMGDYSKFLKRCDDTTIASGIKVFEEVARHGSPWWVKLSAVQALSNISDIYDERQGKAQSKLDDLRKISKDENLIAQKEKEIDNYKKEKDILKDIISQVKKDEKDPNLTKIWDK
jgi:aminopeptidase N